MTISVDSNAEIQLTSGQAICNAPEILLSEGIGARLTADTPMLALLIIDDDPDFLDLVHHVLSEKYECDMVNSAEQSIGTS